MANLKKNFFFIYIKISKNLSTKYYQGNKLNIIKKIKKDYKKKKACERYQNLSKEEKEKKQ